MDLKRTLTRVFRYGMTGGAAAIVDIGVFSVLCPALLPVATAATISFLCAAVVNYTLSSIFVFKAGFTANRFLKFLAFASVGLVVNVTVTVLVVVLTTALPPIAKVVGTGVAFLINFWLNAAFVFRHRDAVNVAAADGGP
jgi:putative flippase GtrA